MAQTEFNLRGGTEADGARLAEVFGAARAALMPFMPVLHTAEEDRRFFSRQLAMHASQIAVHQDRVAGFVIFNSGWIYHLYVHPHWSRQGLGTKLLAEAKTRLPEGFHLWTFQDNRAARAFYEKQGLACVELTDGSGNEEKLPDARYQSTGTPGRTEATS